MSLGQIHYQHQLRVNPTCQVQCMPSTCSYPRVQCHLLWHRQACGQSKLFWAARRRILHAQAAYQAVDLLVKSHEGIEQGCCPHAPPQDVAPLLYKQDREGKGPLLTVKPCCSNAQDYPHPRTSELQPICTRPSRVHIRAESEQGYCSIAGHAQAARATGLARYLFWHVALRKVL